jgi:hypothetical protein
MMNPEKLDDIAQCYVREALSDYVGLWQIIIRVRHDLGISNSTEIKAAVLQIVERMLSNGLEAVALASSGPGCIPWGNQDPNYVLNRISTEWDELGHDPSVGEIAWFNNANTEVRSQN